MFFRFSIHLSAVAVWLLLATACSAPVSETTPTSTPIVIRVGYNSGVDLGDIPSLLAHQRLSQQGYQVETTFYTGPDLAMTAAVEGEIDIFYNSPKLTWLAVDKGANLTLVAEQNANAFVIVSVATIETCADLDGQLFGVHSEGASSTYMVLQYFKENCPDSHPQNVVVAGSDNRAVGLMAGQLKAAVLEMGDLLLLEQKAPGQFQPLADLSSGLPNLVIYGTGVNKDFAAHHPVAVKDYLKAVVEVNRAIAADHAILLAEAARVLDQDQAALQPLVEKYFEVNTWDQNGGLTAEKVTYTYDFLASQADFEVNLTGDQLADLSYLNSVLDEIGRQ